MDDDIKQNGDDNDDVVIEDENTEIVEKLKKIRKELTECRKERDEYLAGWQRAKADFINARKDEEQRREEFIKFSSQELLREIINIADSLELANKHAKNTENEAIEKQLNEMLRRHGVTAITSIGEKYNPMMHEALQQEPVQQEEKDDIVLEEYQKGYMIHNRVLRPAKGKAGSYKKVTSN